MSTDGGTNTKEDDKKPAVIKEIQSLLPLIPVGDLISLRLDIRRMAGQIR